MTTEPRIEVRAEQPCVSIPIRVALREWGRANALVPEVFGWLQHRGIAPGGPLFYRYRVIGGADEEFHLEVGVPLAEPVAGDGRVAAGRVPGGSYAVLTHHGHPDRIRESFAVLEEWARRRGIAWAVRDVAGRTVWDGRFEFYLTDPAVQPDPRRWSTQIAYLLADG